MFNSDRVPLNLVSTEGTIKNKSVFTRTWYRDRKHCKYGRKFKKTKKEKSTQDDLNPLPIFGREHFAGLSRAGSPLSQEGFSFRKRNPMGKETPGHRLPPVPALLFSNPCGMLFREHLTTDCLGAYILKNKLRRGIIERGGLVQGPRDYCGTAIACRNTQPRLHGWTR